MDRQTWVALTLMRLAIALLDQATEMLAAVRLQEAIDVLEGSGDAT